MPRGNFLRPTALLAAVATVVSLAVATSRAEIAANATKAVAVPPPTPLAAPAALPTPSTTPAAAAPKCNVLSDQARLDQPLTRTARRLSGGQPIKIVAIGSSSTFGAGASSPAASYPSRLQVELSKHFPGREFTVLNRGVNGEEAADMLARFETGVIAEKPHLVLWQVGTNSVLRDRPFDSGGTLLHEGIARLKAIRADIILVNPQFAPKVIAKARTDDMVALLTKVANEEKVALFHRFAMMRRWHDVEGLPFDAFVSADGLHMNDWSYACLAKTLGVAIAEAATRPTATASAPRTAR
jgi:lysophospholipase L1-like esterase